MDRGRGRYRRGGGNHGGGRHYTPRGRSQRSAGTWVARVGAGAGAHPDEASSGSGSSEVESRSSEVASVDGVTKKFGKLTSENPSGHNYESFDSLNVSPNDGNLEVVVQNVSGTEPKSLNAPSTGPNYGDVVRTGMCSQSRDQDVENRSPADIISTPLQTVGGQFSPEAQSGKTSSEGTSGKTKLDKPDSQDNEAPFDICKEKDCKVVMLKPSLHIRNKELRDEKRRMQGDNIQTLRPGMIHLKGYLSPTDQEFLEGYNSPFADSEEADPLQMRIADAAYAAEDVIESYIVDTIKLGKATHCIEFNQNLQKVIEEMTLIKKLAMEIPIQDLQQQRKPNAPASGVSGSSSTGLNNDTMVGFEEVLLEIMDRLTAGGVDRQVIPIVGMGGIGKTTLATTLCAQPLVKEHFDVCVWVTISQQFNPKQILCEVLTQASNRESIDEKSEDEVQLAVHQYLSHRRFLIVMDDMWSIDPWNKIERFFPDDNNGSRILVTTRLSALGSQLDKSNATQMKFLDEDSSWALFSQTVFGEESFPLELVEIGKKIVESCKGLPLSIAVIGGLSKKLEHTQECWESIGKNLNSVVSLESDEYCLKILKMSYNHLPAHLKPCFLYMGVFEEDCEIRVSALVRLWISEGFLEPLSGKSLETSAEEYLKDLVGRNLLLVHKLKSSGNIKFCKIHDLLRELCLREARKEKFYNVIDPHYPAIYRERCIVIPKSISEEKLLDALQSMSHARSLICDNVEVRLNPNCGLLRSLHAFDMFKHTHRSCKTFLEDVFELVNLRYLAVQVHRGSKFSSSISLLWNLHSLIVNNLQDIKAPAEIWKMSKLRHVNFIGGLLLPDPPRGSNDVFIMENLQMLKMVSSFKCSEEVVKRIPNIKKLRIKCDGSGDYYSINNLESLHKLESFWCWDYSVNADYLHNLTFPQSLQKLILICEGSECQIALEKIGSLPLLRKLVLIGRFFKTRKWETVEGEFRSLKFLSLEWCGNLEWWETTECSHFPRLEHLFLEGLTLLEEIPLEIGEIPTLKSIELRRCSESAVKSLKKIVEEQEELQGEEELAFHVRVVVLKENRDLESLAAPNFEVEVVDY